MTKEELAKRLDGREIEAEVCADEEAEIKASGLVVVFGASDDLIEFRGAIHGEDDGCVEVFINMEGLMESECGDNDCPHFGRMTRSASKIKALWCEEEGGPAWTYKTNIPHASFNIMEGEEVYCRGIVFDIRDVRP
jgi:hypothetical protein